MEHTEAELQELREFAAGLSAAQRSPWEPRCVARAFAAHGARPIDFTMQAWIELEAMQSPLLQGQMPETLEELELALNAVGQSADELTTEEAMAVAREVMAEIAESFEMALGMREAKADSAGAQGPDGFGGWLPIFACLVTQCGISPADAGAMKVGQAYALIAAHRRNQGWVSTGRSYAERDAVAGLSEPGPGSVTPATTEDAPRG